MPASVTSNFRIANAKAFVDSFEEPENGGGNTITGQSYVYMFIGKVLSWDKTHAGYSDAVIPSPDGDVQGNEYEPWRDMIALDRVIANTDISFAAKRYDWAPGTFDQYDDQDPGIPKATSKYYVYTESGRVFKCLDNNKGSLSTVNPASALIDSVKEFPFVTSDGYRWKYMCKVTTGQALKWLSTNYIPIRTLNAIPFDGATSGELTPGSIPEDNNFIDQADIQKNANTGTIETYVVQAAGAGFSKHSGSVPLASDRVIEIGLGTNTTFFTVKGGTTLASPTGGFGGATVFLSNTTHQKGVSVIQESGSLYAVLDVLNQSPVGATQDASLTPSFLVSPAFPVEFAPLSGDTYHIGPTLEVLGDGPRNTDGTGGANAYAICDSSGKVEQVNAWTTGNNYTTATVNTLNDDGVGLVARAVIPPPGGHGSDPVAELGAFNVIISKSITGSGPDNPVARGSVIPPGSPSTITGNNFPISNQYRTLGLLRNPYIKEDYDGTVSTPGTGGKNWYANSSPLHQSTWLVANSLFGKAGSWAPQADDEIKGAKSGAMGRVIEYNTDGRHIINITNVVANTSGGSFLYDERILRLRDHDGTTYTEGTVYVTANGWGGATNEDYSNLVTQARTGTLIPIASTVIYEPDLQPYTGDILYVENRSPITRSKDQSEDIKIVVEF